MENTSAPTKDNWNTVLSLPWRRGFLGDWIDADRVVNGSRAYATSAPLTGLGRFELSVTSLVSRWLSGQPNKGFYLRARLSDFPLSFAGRTAAAPATRPVLRVVTSSGTVERVARCNACWNVSTSQVISSSDTFGLSQGLQPAIVQFDLSGITGTFVSATLALTLTGQERTGAVIDVLEADPPTFVVPDDVPSPAYGIGADLNYAQMGAHPSVLFNSDMRSPGWADRGYPNPVDRRTDTDGSVYAATYFGQGDFLAADLRADLSKGTGPGGTPDVVREEAYARYWFKLGDNYGSSTDGNKLPGVGVQFGYWSTVGSGYWQNTTGNGGERGTGLKVWNARLGGWEYQGHSIRMLMGRRPADQSAYDGLFAIALYPYNLDQGGAFPPGELFKYILIRKGVRFWVDIRCRQNSMSGARDADGNYTTANPDGIYQVWLNGLLAYSKSTFRWRRHPEFGVQGLWIDWYHGGTVPAPYRMDFEQGYATAATQYIGPPRK